MEIVIDKSSAMLSKGGMEVTDTVVVTARNRGLIITVQVDNAKFENGPDFQTLLSEMAYELEEQCQPIATFMDDRTELGVKVRKARLAEMGYESKKALMETPMNDDVRQSYLYHLNSPITQADLDKILDAAVDING